MHDCPITFASPHLLLPSPLALLAEYRTDAPHTDIKIVFDLPMDTTVVPEVDSFLVLDNAIPTDVATITWATSTDLLLHLDNVDPPTTPLDVSLPAVDQLLRSVTKHLAFPFEFTDIPQES